MPSKRSHLRKCENGQTNFLVLLHRSPLLRQNGGPTGTALSLCSPSFLSKSNLLSLTLWPCVEPLLGVDGGQHLPVSLFFFCGVSISHSELGNYKLASQGEKDPEKKKEHVSRTVHCSHDDLFCRRREGADETDGYSVGSGNPSLWWINLTIEFALVGL